VDSSDNVDTFYYKVAWYGDYEDSWEPVEYLNCPRKTAEFHEQHPDKPRPKPKRKAPIETDTPNAGFGRPAAVLEPIR
jgi:hypothetical protein